MRRRPRFAARGTGIGLLVAAAALFCVACQPLPSASAIHGYGGSGGGAWTKHVGIDHGAQAPPSSFEITGGLAGLYPGATVPLVLTVSNSATFAITVTSIETFVSGPSTPCGRSYLNVGDFTGALKVRARDQASITVFASLSLSSPDGCQGAVFGLRYVGLGHRS